MKFTEVVTACKLREDGSVVLAGDKSGKIELVEIKQKLSLRTYENEHKTQINCLDFAPSKRAFISCANETSWKYFDILK
jgi:WD40 repeat protein